MKVPQGRFKSIIDEQSWSAEDLLDIMAKTTKISEELLWRYYNDESHPTVGHLIAIAHFLNSLLYEHSPVYSAKSFLESEQNS